MSAVSLLSSFSLPETRSCSHCSTLATPSLSHGTNGSARRLQMSDMRSCCQYTLWADMYCSRASAYLLIAVISVQAPVMERRRDASAIATGVWELRVDARRPSGLLSRSVMILCSRCARSCSSQCHQPCDLAHSCLCRIRNTRSGESDVVRVLPYSHTMNGVKQRSVRIVSSSSRNNQDIDVMPKAEVIRLLTEGGRCREILALTGS